MCTRRGVPRLQCVSQLFNNPHGFASTFSSLPRPLQAQIKPVLPSGVDHQRCQTSLGIRFFLRTLQRWHANETLWLVTSSARYVPCMTDTWWSGEPDLLPLYPPCDIADYWNVLQTLTDKHPSRLPLRHSPHYAARLSCRLRWDLRCCNFRIHFRLVHVFYF